MFDTPEYRGFVKIHRELNALAGTPPFEVVLGKKDDDALSFEELRTKVLEICRDGVPLQRFKGLGEMNADQLFETTMDPERRTLQQVTIDDASAADQIFSMLMGDPVEPRREFIENARPRSHQPGCVARCQHRAADRRQHRAARARGGDALLLPRLRHERDRGPRAAGRARRPQARAPPRALRDVRVGSAAEPAVPQVRDASSAT